jgi:tetratricopeptide (TPR) repeat protein
MIRIASLIRVLLAISLCSFATSIAQDTPAPEKEAESKKDSAMQKVWNEFMKLPLEKRKEFGSTLIEVQNQFNRKNIFDALEGINKLNKIFPDHPATLNIQGACYVEMRAFDKATAIFDKIQKIAPDNINVLFNLAEVDFVTNKWESAHAGFSKIIPMLGENGKAMKRLCQFKLLLCKLKTNRIKEAKALSEQYDEWDDSPFYYYSRAAVLYQEDKKLEAEKMLRKVRFVWRNDQALSAWQDTLIEFGYIRSFYGGELDASDKEGEE